MACWLLLLLYIGFCCDLIHSSPSRDNPVPSYFRRVDSTGKLLHRERPEYDDQLPQTFINLISRENAGATLKATPDFVHNGGSVKVTWIGVLNPQEKDFISFYCPVDDKPTHYLDYFHVSESITWSQGYGEHTVVVYNMRTNCNFKYFRGGSHSQLVGVSNVISFGDGGSQAPLQGHLALTGKATEMRIMWVSAEGNEPVVVRYGLTISLDQSEYTHNITSYKAGDMCGSPANSSGFRNPGYIYDVLLKDLKSSVKYYYSYGTKSQMSKISHFFTAIPAGDHTPYKFIAYGDMGIRPYPEAATTAQLVTNDIKSDSNIHFVFHNGDISYAQGQSYIWDQWFAEIEPYATLVPYMVAIGNHEYDHVAGGEHDPSGAPGEGGFRPKWGNNGHDSGGECGVPMYKRFHMPDNGNSIFWYSYDYGMVHYTVMSTEHDFTPGSRQYKWLENDLRTVNRVKTPWVIFGGHRAMYCSELYPGDYVVSINMQRLFEELLYKYKVDLALWAHFHSYERTCKVYRDECQTDGITHIVVGSGGKNTDTDIWFTKKWSMFHINDYGYGRLTVENSTALYWEWIQNEHNKVMDSVWILK